MMTRACLAVSQACLARLAGERPKIWFCLVWSTFGVSHRATYQGWVRRSSLHSCDSLWVIVGHPTGARNAR